MTVEDLMDEHFMEIKYRCLTGRDMGVIRIEGMTEEGYSLSLAEPNKMDYEESLSLDGLSLNDIEELANDMLCFVEHMRRELKEEEADKSDSIVSK